MKTENVSTLGGILAFLLAASCCIGPMIFIVFGVSTGFMARLSFLEIFSPYLLATGIVLLGFSFWRLFLVKPSCHCREDIRVKKIARGLWWFGFMIFSFSISFQKIIIWFYQSHGGAS